MAKKPKTPKKKKKKDPNEPQKPVSAYALFFRDTQASIKGQSPNATFGEVSKIVASMWDGLGEEQKQVIFFSLVNLARANMKSSFILLRSCGWLIQTEVMQEELDYCVFLYTQHMFCLLSKVLSTVYTIVYPHNDLLWQQMRWRTCWSEHLLISPCAIRE